jgi:hypothetical protein
MKFHLDRPIFTDVVCQFRPLTSPVGTANATLTADQTVEGLVVMTPTAARTLTTATAATIVAAIGTGVEVGTSFELTVVNGAASSHAITLTAPTSGGITLGGDAAMATISPSTSATYVGRVTNVSTPAVTFYRKSG